MSSPLSLFAAITAANPAFELTDVMTHLGIATPDEGAQEHEGAKRERERESPHPVPLPGQQTAVLAAARGAAELLQEGRHTLGGTRTVQAVSEGSRMLAHRIKTLLLDVPPEVSQVKDRLISTGRAEVSARECGSCGRSQLLVRSSTCV